MLCTDYSINSILYQRGIYPPETFRRMSKYGLTMLVTSDEELVKYVFFCKSQPKRAVDELASVAA